MTRSSQRANARAFYLSWRDGHGNLDTFWRKRIQRAERMLTLPNVEASPSAQAWWQSSIAISERNLLMNERFLLLILLRARAQGA